MIKMTEADIIYFSGELYVSKEWYYNSVDILAFLDKKNIKYTVNNEKDEVIFFMDGILDFGGDSKGVLKIHNSYGSNLRSTEKIKVYFWGYIEERITKGEKDSYSVREMNKDEIFDLELKFQEKFGKFIGGAFD